MQEIHSMSQSGQLGLGRGLILFGEMKNLQLRVRFFYLNIVLRQGKRKWDGNNRR